MDATLKKPLDGVSVLLVDDYPMNVLFAKGMLQRLGAVVEVAGNGQEALDKVDMASHQVVLMDIQMPIMDGYESTRLMRERGLTLPVIALTADAAGDTLAQVQAAGLSDILVKPFRPDTLTQMILQHI